MVNLGGYNECCNTLDDISGRICVPIKTEDVDLSVLNLITGINESKTLWNINHANVNVNLMIEHIFQIKSGIKINVDVNVKTRKECSVCGKDYISNPTTCTCENDKYLRSIIGDSTKTTSSQTISISFNGRKVNCKTENFYLLLALLLIPISLLIAVSIYYWFIKHQRK